MKTTIIIAAVLSLQINLLFAETKISSTPVVTESVSIISMSLAPATPAKATFEELPSEINSLMELAPTTPAYAEFEDTVDTVGIDFSSLGPVAPVEADFE